MWVRIVFMWNRVARLVHESMRCGVEISEQEIPLEQWQSLDMVWKAILSIESSIDSSRLSMDGLRNEMENAFRSTLAVEDKLNALQADVSQWTKAKSLVLQL